ncbi:hypothetical protein M422DRAFT_244856 [Sphaerobolus stellatus SS14]|nr:hypothetical protein M422DRAFT_244856 [Sphaerobolus stellatus SS14]
MESLNEWTATLAGGTTYGKGGQGRRTGSAITATDARRLLLVGALRRSGLSDPFNPCIYHHNTTHPTLNALPSSQHSYNMISTVSQVVTKLMGTRPSHFNKFESVTATSERPGAQMLDPEDMAW